MQLRPDTSQAAQELDAALRQNPVLAPLLQRWDEIALPDCWLVAGCVAQTFWNNLYARPPEHGLADIDIVYFDAIDLSDDAEAQCAARLHALFADSSLRFDVKNQARVHLWYGSKFGFDIPPYRSAAHAISTYPSTATSIGIAPDANGLKICTPFGLDDLTNGVVRANRTLAGRAVFEAKAARWSAHWPDLVVLPWEDGVG